MWLNKKYHYIFHGDVSNKIINVLNGLRTYKQSLSRMGV
jgi:hypothetical protein